MSDFILLQNYARNFLLRYFMSLPTTLDVEPGFKGKLELISTGWRGSVKVVGRERTNRSLLVDPRWESESPDIISVYLLDAGLVWMIDAPRLFGLLARNPHMFEERYGKRSVPWSAITQHVGGQCLDIRGVNYLNFEQYRSLHS